MRGTLLFIIFAMLCIQVISVNRISEPYPAILSPGGGGTIPFQSYYLRSYYYFKVTDSDSTQHIITTKAVLPTIPKNYRPYVLKNYLGFPVQKYDEVFYAEKIRFAKSYLKSNIMQNTHIKEPINLHLMVKFLNYDLSSKSPVNGSKPKTEKEREVLEIGL